MNDILKAMHKFQKENNINNQCITNCVYLKDQLSINQYGNVKSKAFFVVGYNVEQNKQILCHGHVALVHGNDIIEPSYEIYKLKNRKYFDSFKGLKMHNKIPELSDKQVVSNTLKSHQSFIEIANTINRGVFYVEQDYYNQQADFVEEKLKSKLTRLF